jgi:hypothetical protein
LVEVPFEIAALLLQALQFIEVLCSPGPANGFRLPHRINVPTQQEKDYAGNENREAARREESPVRL